MINSSVGEYDVRECWAYDYTDPMIQSMLFLNFGEHVGFFRDVMKNFEIKRVIMFPFLRNPLNFIYLKKTETSFLCFNLADYSRTTSDRLGQNNFGNRLGEMSIMF
jgi:hypothetical protein